MPGFCRNLAFTMLVHHISSLLTVKKPLSPAAEYMLIHFDDLFEEFSKRTIKTKRELQVNGALISANLYIPDSFLINGHSLSDLKGKILKTSLTEKGVSIEGIHEDSQQAPA